MDSTKEEIIKGEAVLCMEQIHRIFQKCGTGNHETIYVIYDIVKHYQILKNKIEGGTDNAI